MVKKKSGEKKGRESRTLSVPGDLVRLIAEVCESANETPELRPDWQDVAVSAMRRGLTGLARKAGVETA